MKKFMAVLAVVALVAFAAPAFAANPFADVPAGHWAYDAVAQLAADGLISGYPDGQFKGPQKATRYEVAAMVARAAANGDAKHASKKDIELLKKLMVEFKDELDALGAKVDKLDKRVGKLEKGIGSWKISGRMKFDATFAGGDNEGNTAWTARRGKRAFTRDYARMFFRRQITADTYFDSQFRLGSDWATSAQPGTNGQGDSSAFSVRKFYIGTKLPFWGLDLKLGRFDFDFEGEYGLYTDEDALFGDWRVDGFGFKKAWKTVKADFIVGRNSSGGTRFWTGTKYYGVEDNEETKANNKNEHMLYALNLKWTPNDKFTAGAMAYWMQGDGESYGNYYVSKLAAEQLYAHGMAANIQTYGVTLGYKFTEGVALKGIYYWQKNSDPKKVKMNGSSDKALLDENSHAWKVMLDVKQSVLKFTDLWVEYAQMSNGFGGNNGTNGGVNCYSMGGISSEPGILWVRPVNNETAKIWFITANQKWNKKWSTFVRFNHGNWGTDGLDNAWDWGIGVKYKLNPAITFTLAYDEINYGDNNASNTSGHTQVGDYSGLKGKDRVVFFQTDVKF